MVKRGIPDDFIEQVKAANNIVAVAGRYVPLKQKGKSYWGNCPFHHEKSASFAVHEHQQFYKCFGCGVSGNVITLVKQLESTDFIGAVELLAKWANMNMPTVKMDNEWLVKRKKKERVLEVLDIAREFYCENLYKQKNKEMLLYLHRRGINDELIKLFNIGASDDWNEVVNLLKNRDYSDDEIIDSGVAAKGDRGLYDVMRGRITFSIFDIYGSCIGFTGRMMSTDKDVAKYRNTAQTIVFDKGAIVYGVDVLKKNKLANFVDKLIVVEGNVDVITLVGAGFPNTVACMGTALTQFHARVFKRFSPNVYLCFDGDKSGKAATLRSVDILGAEGLNVRVVEMPDDVDPDTFVSNNGNDEFQKIMDSAKPMIDYKLDELEKVSNLSDNLGRTEYFKKAVEILKPLDSEAELYIGKVAATSGFSPDAVMKALGGGITEGTSQISHTIYERGLVKNEGGGNRFEQAEKFIVASIVHGKIDADWEKLREIDLKNGLYRKLLEIVEGRKKDGKRCLLGDIYDIFDDDERDQIKHIIDYEFQMGQTELERFYGDSLKRLEEVKIKKKRDELNQKFIATKDTVERERLLQEIQKLNKGVKNDFQIKSKKR